MTTSQRAFLTSIAAGAMKTAGAALALGYIYPHLAAMLVHAP